MLLDEILYMQVRIFRAFLERSNMKAADAHQLFEQNGIWDYIESGYDVFHLNGDECVLNDVLRIINNGGAAQ